MSIKISNNNNNINIDLIDIEDALKKVFDPEIHIDIYSLGLIYEINLFYNHVHIVMTLTDMACPFANTLPEMVKNSILEQLQNSNITIDVEVTYDPPFRIENLSDEILLRLGLL